MSQVPGREKTFRALSVAGGGMRGLSTAVYLSSLEREFARNRGLHALDIGKGFDLIAGTSTGGIIACALAAGIPLARVAQFYRDHGKAIFPAKLPAKVGWDFAVQLFTRRRHLRAGGAALRAVLDDALGNTTLGEAYAKRGIALAIPTIEMARHEARVFKTPHLGGHRDDDFRLVDVCMATTAAPIFLPLARVENSGTGHAHVFADGGLWANNPVLVALLDALDMTKPGDRIEIFSVGPPYRPGGHAGEPDDLNWGLQEWKFGARAMSLALDVQETAFDWMAREFARHVHRDCRIVRFPRARVPADAMPYLELDETSPKGLRVLEEQAQGDVALTLSLCSRGGEDGRPLCELFNALPAGEVLNSGG